MALAHRAGLADLVSSTLILKAIGGVNAHLKVPALVAGMVAGADSIDDMDLLRHGGMGRLFTGVRAGAKPARPADERINRDNLSRSHHEATEQQQQDDSPCLIVPADNRK